MAAGECLRGVIPLGLHTCAPFRTPPRLFGEDGPIIREVVIIPAAETTIEEETRRNIFWLCAQPHVSYHFQELKLPLFRILAYTVDREQSVSQALPLTLDDRNVLQMLPARADYFHYGVSAHDVLSTGPTYIFFSFLSRFQLQLRIVNGLWIRTFSYIIHLKQQTHSLSTSNHPSSFRVSSPSTFDINLGG
jgi:hypothetical protein